MSENPQTEYRQSRFIRPPGASEIILVRHGESAPARMDEPFPLVDGQGDPPLHEPDGVTQAKLTGERLLGSGEDIAAVYVSTLRRTHETAAPLVEGLGVEPIIEPDLREVHLGEWEGGEFRKRTADGDPLIAEMWETRRWDVIPGAENQEAYVARVRGVINKIAARHRDELVVAFTHGAFIGQVMVEATQCDNFAFTFSDNCGITHIVVNDERWSVRTWNDTAHLSSRFTHDPMW